MKDISENYGLSTVNNNESNIVQEEQLKYFPTLSELENNKS